MTRFGRLETTSDSIPEPQNPIGPISRRSRPAPLPPGAAFARLCHATEASEGGGGGERFPLVGPSNAGSETCQRSLLRTSDDRDRSQSVSLGTSAMKRAEHHHPPDQEHAMHTQAGHEQSNRQCVLCGCRQANTMGTVPPSSTASRLWSYYGATCLSPMRPN